MNCIVVNMFGGSGIGKSTNAAELFVMCKKNGINAEYVDEYVKPMVYEKREGIFKCQDYIFGKQLWKIQRAAEECEVVITDSPIILSTIYDPEQCLYFRNHAIKKFNQFNNLNIVLKRDDSYFRTEGRMQANVEEAKETDKAIKELMHNYKISYVLAEPTTAGCEEIFKLILQKLNK